MFTVLMRTTSTKSALLATKLLAFFFFAFSSKKLKVGRLFLIFKINSKSLSLLLSNYFKDLAVKYQEGTCCIICTVGICAEDTTATGQYFIHFCHRNDQNKGHCCPLSWSLNSLWQMHCGFGNRTDLYRHFQGVISLPQGI